MYKSLSIANMAQHSLYTRCMHIKANVTPDARKDVVVFKNDRYHISTKAPASQGQANIAAKMLLAEYFDIPPNKLSLIKGATTPSKIFLRRD